MIAFAEAIQFQVGREEIVVCLPERTTISSLLINMFQIKIIKDDQVGPMIGSSMMTRKTMN
jgi:hypothetical protein